MTNYITDFILHLRHEIRILAHLRASFGDIMKVERPQARGAEEPLLDDDQPRHPSWLPPTTRLRTWRDSLLAKGLAPGTVNRTKTRAAHEPRIANERAWKVGLATLREADRARKVILDDATVRCVVATAYDHDRALGAAF